MFLQMGGNFQLPKWEFLVALV